MERQLRRLRQEMCKNWYILLAHSSGKHILILRAQAQTPNDSTKRKRKQKAGEPTTMPPTKADETLAIDLITPAASTVSLNALGLLLTL